jgi:hypothetical protein
MELFTSHSPSATFYADFEQPWISWRRYVPLETMVQQAIELVTTLRLATRSNSCRFELVAGLVQTTEAIAGNLEIMAANARVQSMTFNGLIAITSATSAAVVSSLYLTVRLHLFEALHDFLGANVATLWQDQADCLSTVTPAMSKCAGQLLERVTAALHAQDKQPTRALRMFCLGWPLLATMQSPLTGDDIKATAMHSVHGY